MCFVIRTEIPSWIYIFEGAAISFCLFGREIQNILWTVIFQYSSCEIPPATACIAAIYYLTNICLSVLPVWCMVYYGGTLITTLQPYRFMISSFFHH